MIRLFTLRDRGLSEHRRPYSRESEAVTHRAGYVPRHRGPRVVTADGGRYELERVPA